MAKSELGPGAGRAPEPRFYRILGLGKGLDGLLVEAADESLSIEDGDTGETLICVSRLRNQNIVEGDREVSMPLPGGALYISEAFLQIVEDDPRQREYASDNPFGKFISEIVHTLASGETLCVVRHEKCVSVTLRDESRTLFSQNFFQLTYQVLEDVQSALDGYIDANELHFILEDRKSAEKGMDDGQT